MDDWKKIAEMYKEEVMRLQDGIDCCIEELNKELPYCHKNVVVTLRESLKESDANCETIKTLAMMVPKEQSSLEKRKKRPKIVSGKLVGKTYEITEDDKYSVKSKCRNFPESTRQFAIVKEYATLYASRWLLDTELYHLLGASKGLISAVNIKNKRLYSIRVICSWLAVGGRTAALDSLSEKVEVPPQRTYIVEDQERIQDIYIFCDYQSDKFITIYAWVKGSRIHKMLFKPIRGRFSHLGCILQKTSNTGKEFPCSIDELLKREGQ